MLKTIDRIYFNLRNVLRDPNEMFAEGMAAGREVEKAQILRQLSDKSLAGFSNASLALGYNHAVEIVKGELK